MFKRFISKLRLKLGLDITFADYLLKEVDKLLSNWDFVEELCKLIDKYND